MAIFWIHNIIWFDWLHCSINAGRAVKWPELFQIRIKWTECEKISISWMKQKHKIALVTERGTPKKMFGLTLQKRLSSWKKPSVHDQCDITQIVLKTITEKLVPTWRDLFRSTSSEALKKRQFNDRRRTKRRSLLKSK